VSGYDLCGGRSWPGDPVTEIGAGAIGGVAPTAASAKAVRARCCDGDGSGDVDADNERDDR
jgi:hypothetical protein